MQKITPFLWFNDNVEEAFNFYAATFKNTTVTDIRRTGEGFPGEKGKVFTATLRVGDQAFYGLNGGPMFSFSPAVSLFVNCEKKEDIDDLWQKLSDGGVVFMPLNKYPFSEKYGWVQDRFGMSWQLNLTGSKQTITPFLTFVKENNGKAEEAMNFYTSLFKNSSVLRVAHYGANQGGTEGTVVHAAFSLDGLQLMAMDSNGEHNFTFTPAISFFINCHTQEEVDYFWEKLSEGGRKDRCGWVADKYGVSWQVIPDVLMQLLYSADAAKSNKAMQAMLKMDKLIIKDLQEAYDQQ